MGSLIVLLNIYHKNAQNFGPDREAWIIFSNKWATFWNLEFKKLKKNLKKNLKKISFSIEFNDLATKASAIVLRAQVDRITKRVHFALMKVTFLGIVVPPFLTTVINYVVLGLGEDSYIVDSTIA